MGANVQNPQVPGAPVQPAAPAMDLNALLKMLSQVGEKSPASVYIQNGINKAKQQGTK